MVIGIFATTAVIAGEEIGGKMFADMLKNIQIVDDIEVQYNCPACRDSGYVPVSDEPKAPYRKCQCLVKEELRYRYEKLVHEANISDLRHMTFERFKPQNERQKRVFNVIKAKHGSFYLFGPWGVGKTHLMAATIFRAIKNDIPSVLISVPKLLDAIRKQGRDSDTDIEKLAMTIPYLVLDDIGKQKDSDWTEERLFMLIDERYRRNYTGRCHTSFTSQYPLDMLAKRMDGAIIDRIRGMCEVMFIDGESMRKKTLDK